MADWFTKDASGFFTFCLAVIGIVQLLLFYVQLRLIRKSLNDAQEAAKASTAAAEAATRQAAIAEESFADLERPYIYIFGAKRLELEENTPDPFHYLEYSVANYGKTPASIDEVHVGISVGLSPEQPHDVGHWHSLVLSPILKPNELWDDLTQHLPETIATEDYADEDTPPVPIPALEDDKDFFSGCALNTAALSVKDMKPLSCWHWSWLRLASYGGEEYNYHR